MSPKSSDRLKLLDTEISFELIRTPKRRSVSILISPTGDITVKAPKNLNSIKLNTILATKLNWILSKLNYFKRINVNKTTKEFIEGEKHLYLGKDYALKIKEDTKNSAYIEGNFLVVNTNTPKNELKIKKILSDWYWQQAKEIFETEFEKQFAKFNIFNFKKPILTVERLTKKWGQCSNSGHIKLNKDLIKMPMECIRYVIIHEICHLKEHNHSKRFYALLETQLPDWKTYKHKLQMLSYSL